MKNSLFCLLLGVILGILLELRLEAARKQFRESSEAVMEATR